MIQISFKIEAGYLWVIVNVIKVDIEVRINEFIKIDKSFIIEKINVVSVFKRIEIKSFLIHKH